MKKYQLIYADPPWNISKGGIRKARPRQGRELDYPVLGISAITDIIGKIDADILFLWTVDKYLFEAQRMAESLGYRLHARIIWDKGNGVAPAFTVRFSHEYLLWMYRNFIPIDREMRGKYTTVLREKSARHSQKPSVAYEMIERLYPNLSRIELFARNKRDGWDVWGNEVESDIEL